MPSQVSSARKNVSIDEDEGVGHVGERRGEGGAETFAHVDDGVDEYGDLEPPEMRQRGPGVVDTAQESDRHDDHPEDEADLLRLDAGADGEAECAGGQAGEDEDDDKKWPAADVCYDRGRRDVVGQREDDGGGDHALDGREAHLLDGDGGDRRGHMTRSSISRVMPNSCASGRATAAMPVNMMATAMRPGSRTVLKFMPAMEAVGFMARAAHVGMMKVKTKRKSSGFMQTRMTKGKSSRRRT